MYFTKYQPLKERLRTRSISDKEALPYLVVISALTALIVGLPATTGSPNAWDYLSVTTSTLLAIGGILYSYRCNDGNKGFDLIQKYVVLGWVVAVRCFLAFIPAAIAFYAITDLLGILSDQTSLPEFILLTCFEVILYQRIGRHIRDTTNNQSEQDVAHNSGGCAPSA